MSPSKPGSGAASGAKPGIFMPVIVVIIAAIALGLAIYFTVTGGDDAEPAAEVHTSNEDQPRVDEMAHRKDGDPMAMGDVDAPVVMVNYSDFQCPFCGKFARDSQPELIDKYVKDGTLRVEWRDFPYFGDDSVKAALAARAAAAQDKFWEFHDALYDDQPEMNSGAMTDEFFIEIAKDIGLDVDKFTADYTSKKYQDAVNKDFSEGQSIGVSGTPTFLINGIPVVGAQPLSTFTDIIDNEAREAP